MLMPSLLPDELISYVESESEEVLFNSLARSPANLIRFFDYACDDETWSNKHLDFMRRALTWVTIQSFQGLLAGESLEQAAKSIRSHYDNLRSILPHNLIFKFSDTSIQVNSALYSAASPFFHDLIRRECFDKKNFKLEFRGVSYSEVFRFVEEFANTGYVEGLWKMEQREVMPILRYSKQAELEALAQICEEVLAKYISLRNVCDTLLMAHKEFLRVLERACFNFINGEELGIHLEAYGPGSLACRFLNFSEKAMEIFGKIASEATHLLFSDETPNNPAFAVVVRQCPKLVGINLSHTNNYPEHFAAVPGRLQELNLSACEWLSASYLKLIIDKCPHVHTLGLASNVQLTANGWGELMKLQGLSSLDISRCQQVKEDDFRIILHACAGVMDLNLEDCKLITERAFYDLARTCPRLQKLNLARTLVSDASLVEIASRCRVLAYLDLTRCDRITDKGVVEAVKNGFNLCEVNLTNCHVTRLMVDELQAKRPQLRILANC